MSSLESLHLVTFTFRLSSFVFRLLCLALPLVFAVSNWAAHPDDAVPASSMSDTQDILFFGDERPMLMRLHMVVDGKPFRVVWDEHIRKLFRYLDRDGDRVLSKQEASQVPMPQPLGQGFANLQTTTASDFGGIDTNRDGEVTIEELANYYRRVGGGPFQILVGQGRNRLGDELFRRLDADGDDALTEAELHAADTRLRDLDANDDEMIGMEELIPNASYGQVVTPVAAGGATVLSSDTAFAAVSPGEPVAGLGRFLLDRYDRNPRDGKLSPAEIGLDLVTFERLDRDRDGSLNSDELEKFSEIPPDLTLCIRLGDASREVGPQGFVGPDAASGPLASRVRRPSPWQIVLDLETARIDLELRNGPQASFGLRESYKQQFRVADTDNNKYLDTKEVERNGLFRSVFALMDRDGDGKLFEEEMDAYLEQEAEALASRLALSVADHGRSIFEALDTNRDRRLGVRELRTALRRLAPLDRNGDVRIGRDQITHSYQLALARGAQAGFGGGFPPGVAAPVGDAGPSPTRDAVPLWFRRMDRNGDGDVSRREFLGRPADFRRLDADGDGLIDADEARRARP